MSPSDRCRPLLIEAHRPRTRWRGARSNARHGRRRRSPWSRLSERIVSKRRDPSPTSVGSGQARSSVTIGGSSARRMLIAASRSEAIDHVIIVIGPAQLPLQASSSSTINSLGFVSVVMRTSVPGGCGSVAHRRVKESEVVTAPICSRPRAVRPSLTPMPCFMRADAEAPPW